MHTPFRRRTLAPLLASGLVTACAGVASSAAPAATRPPLPVVRHRTVDVGGIQIFYREAGDPAKPTLLLLHGFPSSSFMYRNLMLRLADDFHVVAPDHPGSGFSDHPPAERFTPTFAQLADVMLAFTDRIGLTSYLLYVQDFGGPVGFRMAVKRPDAVKGLIVQNANAYVEGIAPEQLEGMQRRSAGLTADGRRQVEQLVSREFTLVLYRTGARDFAAVDPTGWNLDALLLEKPEVRRIQIGLMLDYYSNVLDYPRWHAFLRARQPKTLIVWGKNDPIFLPAGAEAYRRDLPDARLQFLDTGHFALEEEGPRIADEIRSMFAGR